MARGPFAGMGMTEKSLNFGPSARRLLGRLYPERMIISVVMVLSLIGVTLTVVGPKILGHATDLIFAGVLGKRLPAGVSKAQVVAQARASGNGKLADLYAKSQLVPGKGIDFTALSHVLSLVLALYFVASFFGWLQGYLLNGAVQRTVFQLRQDVEGKLNRLPLRFFDGQPRGEVLSRVTNDIDNISQTLTQTMSQMLNSALTIIAVLTMMLVISPLLALIALVSVPLSIVLTKVIAGRSQKLFVAQWKTTGELNGQIEEAFSGHALVKVFGRQHEVEASFSDRNDELYRSSFGAQFVSGLIMPAVQFIGNLNYVAVAVVGGLRVATGTMSLGDVQAFIQYSRQFTQPLTQVASMANVLQSGVASAERVFELLDADEQRPEVAVPAVIEAAHGRVEFEGVSFRYEPETPLIDELSFVAAPGQTVAIVGPTGAGKTTLVNLIMRFYELDSGRITLDGADISELTRADLRSRIGMVLQDTWLFGGTIRDNIGYGDPAADESAIIAAARATFVDRFVHSLPDGYDTVIDDEGSNVSAGEKQLLTIARAFLANPSLLILDEATSSVDTRTELLVQQAMAALRSDRTSFVIAHRLSTIRDADLILVMEAGRIVEQGTHTELLEAKGAYYTLYNAQFAGAVT
ncbi:MAG: ABC transporter ATP-binding protein/permease [Actinomycetota bacterium]|nr:ABC transporter ATP-binding protein/permease [Actinomycetota bacterium]